MERFDEAPERRRHGVSRRAMLGALGAASLARIVNPDVTVAFQDAACAEPLTDSELLGTLPLFRGNTQSQPFATKYGGSGLDARQIVDLSTLTPETLITPNDLAYIRSEMPVEAANRPAPWTIATSGLGAAPGTLSVQDLEARATPQGAHLFECSGNANPANFGLISVAEWDGVPLAEIVSRLKPSAGATGVLVAGVDPAVQVSRASVNGASWVFPLADLDRLGAFLAVRMNGVPLPPDHGRPVRLVVPGWYGCTWIKWVDEIRLVGADEPATSQMKEFASRTHQPALYELAREYAPAAIQAAATPVRVEKRRGRDGGIEYRVVGIVWGGTRPARTLAIRFRPEDAFLPFTICPAPATSRIWSLWHYRWVPTEPGLYTIALRVVDPDVPQRRLDSGYYVRQVRIDESGRG